MRTYQLILGGFLALAILGDSKALSQQAAAPQIAAQQSETLAYPNQPTQTNQYATDGPAPQTAPGVQVGGGPQQFSANSSNQTGWSTQTGLASTQIRWRNGLAEARQEAQETGKPLMLHFFTQPCIYCEKLEQGAFRDPAVVAEIESKFVPVQIYGPDNAKATEALGVDRYPTDVVLKADGTILMRTVSPQDPQAYISMLATARQKATNLQGLAISLAPAPQNSASPGNARLTAMSGQPNNNFEQPANSPQISSVPEQKFATQNEFAQQQNFAPQMTEPRQFGQLKNGSQFEQTGSPSSSGSPSATVRIESQEPMMEGYCLVTMTTEWRWVMGDPNIGAMHLGRLYLFANQDARRSFLADPNRFAPVMNGLDVVKFFDEGRVVEGVRAKGCTTRNPDRIFFFSSEESLAKFEASERSQAYYTSRAIELAERAAADANGGR